MYPQARGLRTDNRREKLNISSRVSDDNAKAGEYIVLETMPCLSAEHDGPNTEGRSARAALSRSFHFKGTARHECACALPCVCAYACASVCVCSHAHAHSRNIHMFIAVELAKYTFHKWAHKPPSAAWDPTPIHPHTRCPSMEPLHPLVQFEDQVCPGRSSVRTPHLPPGGLLQPPALVLRDRAPLIQQWEPGASRGRLALPVRGWGNFGPLDAPNTYWEPITVQTQLWAHFFNN